MDPFVDTRAPAASAPNGRSNGQAAAAAAAPKPVPAARHAAPLPVAAAAAASSAAAAGASSAATPAVPSRHPSQSPRLSPASESAPPPSIAAAATASSGSKSAAIKQTFQKPAELVRLNVYDLHPYNQYLHKLGFGAYHTAVELFGREYSFGFHDTSETGVFAMQPRRVPNAVFRESIEVGQVYITFSQFNVILAGLKEEWRGNSYHLLKRNCNSFSKALLAALGLKAPSFINRLASAGETLASIVPAFMLPKQVNAVIQTGRPDMHVPPEEIPPPHSARGAPAAAAGVPTLSGRSNAGGAGVPNLGGAAAALPASYSSADGLDDEQFAEFLRQSEREYQQEQLKQRSQSSASESASAPPPSTRPRPASASSAESFSSRSLAGQPLQPPLTPAEEAQVERAMADFDLPADVSAAERAQIRQVLAISIRAGAKI